MTDTTRAPACDSRFYPSERAALQESVDSYVDESPPELGGRPEAVIAPHAGYVYSGMVAGRAYGAAAPIAESVERVVLIGPSHFTRFEGLASSRASAFETPLGMTPLDRETIDELASRDVIHVAEEPHRDEHSLETHLPFIQTLFGEVELVPVVTGEAPDEAVADLIEETWNDRETFVAVSSDLSHHLDYETARDVDRTTCEAIESLEPDDIGRRDACGRLAIRGLLLAADRRELSVETLDLQNSGDTAGGRDEVVGYGAWVLGDD